MKSKASKKLTPDDRRLLWQMRDEQNKLRAELAKISNAELAKKMDVHISAIENLFAGRTYKKGANIDD